MTSPASTLTKSVIRALLIALHSGYRDDQQLPITDLENGIQAVFNDKALLERLVLKRIPLHEYDSASLRELGAHARLAWVTKHANHPLLIDPTYRLAADIYQGSDVTVVELDGHRNIVRGSMSQYKAVTDLDSKLALGPLSAAISTACKFVAPTARKTKRNRNLQECLPDSIWRNQSINSGEPMGMLYFANCRHVIEGEEVTVALNSTDSLTANILSMDELKMSTVDLPDHNTSVLSILKSALKCDSFEWCMAKGGDSVIIPPSIRFATCAVSPNDAVGQWACTVWMQDIQPCYVPHMMYATAYLAVRMNPDKHTDVPNPVTVQTFADTILQNLQRQLSIPDHDARIDQLLLLQQAVEVAETNLTQLPKLPKKNRALPIVRTVNAFFKQLTTILEEASQRKPVVPHEHEPSARQTPEKTETSARQPPVKNNTKKRSRSAKHDRSELLSKGNVAGVQTEYAEGHITPVDNGVDEPQHYATMAAQLSTGMTLASAVIGTTSASMVTRSSKANGNLMSVDADIAKEVTKGTDVQCALKPGESLSKPAEHHTSHRRELVLRSDADCPHVFRICYA